MLFNNKKVILKSRPAGFPILENFDIINEEINELEYGQVIIEVIWLSLDPYMRGRMSQAKSYASPIEIGEVITGGAGGQIIESRCPNFEKGNIVEGFTIGWQKYARVSSNNIRKIDPNIAPILNDPVSPIKIFAGYLLYLRKPRHKPDIE